MRVQWMFLLGSEPTVSKHGNKCTVVVQDLDSSLQCISAVYICNDYQILYEVMEDDFVMKFMLCL
jgi:hypothetical protein